METAPDESAPPAAPAAAALEGLWSGPFGDAYIDRNRDFGSRCNFWAGLLERFPCRRALEVGCNIGGNLTWIQPETELALGIDVNVRALRLLHRSLGTAAVRASGRAIPFCDDAFDLVVTAGLLIHIDDAALPEVFAEILRCSSRYVLMAEYFAPEKTEVPYRGQPGALFKRDFGRLLEEAEGTLELRERGELDHSDGFDRATYWLYEKPSRLTV